MTLFTNLFWPKSQSRARESFEYCSWGGKRKRAIVHCIFGSKSKSANSSFQGCWNRGGRGAIDQNILADQYCIVLSIVSQTVGWGRCPPHYNQLPSQHISGPSYGPAPSFMYAAKNKNYFSEKKETVVVSLVRDSVIQSVILILACFYKADGDKMSGEELTISSVSCIYPPCQTKSCTTFLHGSTKLGLKKAVLNEVAGIKAVVSELRRDFKQS